MKKYTTRNLISIILFAIGFGLLSGLARIRFGLLANVSDLVFSVIIGAVIGVMSPFLLKPKE